MTAADVRRIVLSHFERFNDHDWAIIEQATSDDFVDHEEVPGFANDAAGTRQRLEYFATAFPDIRLDVLDVIADERRGVARIRVTGTHEHEFMGIDATGRSIDLEMVDIVAFNDRGEVTEHWGYADNLTLLQQLGAVPDHLLPTG